MDDNWTILGGRNRNGQLRQLNGYLRTDMGKMGKTCTKSEENNERLWILHKQF